MDEIGENIDIIEYAKPRIDVNALAANMMHTVMVNTAVSAVLLDVNAFLVAVIDQIVRNLEIDCPPNADRLMWRLIS